MKVSMLFALLMWAMITPASAQQIKAQRDVERPKLVVGIVVDQMRWDYLYRYYDRYSDNGFRRMLEEGFTNENAYIDYVPTVTAIGHATTYTGSVPAIHGIAGNDFIIQENGKRMYCTQDDSVNSVGTTGTAGKMSPKNLLTSTVTDELKLATNFRSKVIGVAIKDRGSIIPAGHFADAAYWFEGSTGKFITSDFYMKELPGWVNAFNDRKLPEEYLKKDWTTLYPIETYKQSTKDDNLYEGKLGKSENARFPVRTSALLAGGGNAGLVSSTPFGNTLTLEMAKAALINEKMGKNAENVPDFLAVSLSSPDYIGHQYGVNSIKVEDNYLRLDKDLGDFFSFLDKEVGKGNYTVFMTADHGAAHNPQFFIDSRGMGGYFNNKQMMDTLNHELKRLYNFDNLVISLSNYQIHLNNDLIRKTGLDERAIRQTIVDRVKKIDNILFVVDMDNVGAAAIPELIRERIINGYNHKRSGAITFVLDPQMYSASPRATGTTHGSAFAYDSHVPLVWFGWGIKKGRSVQRVNMTDIAPTVAALLRIQEPNGNIGEPISDVIK